jgi:hypothetical protein
VVPNIAVGISPPSRKRRASNKTTPTDAQSVTELDGGHATAILECSSVKTREEIEQGYQNNVEILYIEFGDKLREVAAARDAALAELDDPMARLFAAAKAHVEGILREHVNCYPSGAPCPVVREIANLRDAIDYAEQRRAQG